MTDEPAHSRRYGVLIASSRFPEEPKLQDLACPENDADGLFEVLSDEVIGGFTELQVVKNQPSYAILRSVHKVLLKAGRDDLVLIFYAGHGKLDRGGRLHLATLDTVNDELETTSIPAQRIRDLIDNTDTRKTALILDCCYSGAIEKSFLRGHVDEQMNILAGGSGTYIMTASTAVQTAREEVLDGYGVFTKHIIDGIRGEADVDGDGLVTMNELYSYVHRQVPGESHQVPMKWDLNVQGELVIARTGRKPREERRLAIREQLFKLADAGAIPDLVLTKAVEISNLSFEQTRSGAAACYDKLLDRLLDEDLRVGRFINDWLQVPPDVEPEAGPLPEARPEPPPTAWPGPRTIPGAREGEAAESEPSRQSPTPGPEPTRVSWFWKLLVFPYPATQDNLDRHPLYRMCHGIEIREREQARLAAGGKLTMSWGDVASCLGWIVIGPPFVGVMLAAFNELDISYFSPYTSGIRQEVSGALTGAIVWAAFGRFLQWRARRRLNTVVRSLYWLGIAGCLAFMVFAASRL